MSSNSIEIKDYDLVETKTVKKVAIQVIQLVLNTSCKINYQLYDTDSKLIKCGLLDISSDEYNSWGADDNFLIDLVISKLGFTKAI